MKTLRWIVPAVMAVMVVYVVPAFADDESFGEWVSSYAAQGETKLIPPGQFAAAARLADEFLTPINGDPAHPGGHRSILAADVASKLTNYFIVDVRTPAEFCKDSVPGAINIELKNLAKPETLAILPTDKPILLVCNSGHTASVANAVLGTLGYDAWSLKFGMIGWRGTNLKAYSSKQTAVVVPGLYAADDKDPLHIQRCQ